MRLKVLHQGTWKIVSPLNEQGECELVDELIRLSEDKKLKGYALGFTALFKQCTDEGPRRKLVTDLFHCVDDQEGIYEFIKGPLRLLCFEGDGALVICTNVFRKKAQKTKAKDKNLAIAMKAEYLAARDAQTIEFVEGED